MDVMHRVALLCNAIQRRSQASGPLEIASYFHLAGGRWQAGGRGRGRAATLAAAGYLEIVVVVAAALGHLSLSRSLDLERVGSNE